MLYIFVWIATHAVTFSGTSVRMIDLGFGAFWPDFVWIHYRMQARKRLARCFQKKKTVTEYAHELQELFNMIGMISERDRVLKLWSGVKPDIQSALWRSQLNPEVSNWDEVLAQAEIIEISENVARRREGQAGWRVQFSSRSHGSAYWWIPELTE
jgi:hypothetical protein